MALHPGGHITRPNVGSPVRTSPIRTSKATDLFEGGSFTVDTPDGLKGTSTLPLPLTTRGRSSKRSQGAGVSGSPLQEELKKRVLKKGKGL